MPFRFFSLFRRPPPEPPGPQYGAVPYAVVDGELVVLLVTSRGRGRWIFPKGGHIPGLSPWESAAREAYEEAGVTGDIEKSPIGSYVLPANAERRHPIEVKLFALRVTHQSADWKEKAQRERQWAGIARARALVTHEGLAEITDALAHRRTPAAGARP